MAGPIDLTDTWGVIFIVLVIETLLYGMGLLQVWLYFLWYPKDSWSIRLVVIWLTAVETTQLVLFAVSSYWVFVTNFMNPKVLTILKPMDTAQYFAGYISAFTVQLYFAHSLWKLANKKTLVVAGIVFLSVVSFGTATALSVIVGIKGDFKKIGKPVDRKLAAVQTATNVACDIAITIALTTMFKLRKSGIKGTNAMLQTLTINAVNRGILTAVCAALNMILFLGLPGKLYYFIGLVLSSKLYMNSMLATLNTRQRIRDIGGGNEHYTMNVSLAASGRPELSTIMFEGKSGQTSTHVDTLNSREGAKHSNSQGKSSTVFSDNV